MPDPKKRLHADGTHTWQTTCYLGRDATGKRRTKRVTARTKEACARAAAAILTDAGRGELPDAGTMTFGQFCDRWLDALTSVAPTTRHRYRTHVERHIKPAIGHIPLAKLSPLDVQRFLRRQLAAGYAPRTVVEHLARVRQVCNAAVAWRLLVRSPCLGVAPPRVVAAEPATWSAEEMRRFLASEADDALFPLWLVALSTGLRIGELVGLSWGDVDLERGLLTIRKTVTRDETGHEVMGTTTKGKRQRIVPLTRQAVDELRALRERRPGIGEAPVFANARGQRWHTNSIRHRLHVACERAGVPVISPHSLRRTFATLAAELGIYPGVVADLLGHSNPMLTMQFYTRINPAMLQTAADQLGAMIGEVRSGANESTRQRVK